MTVEEIKDLIRFLKEEKVMVFKVAGLEGQFHPAVFQDLEEVHINSTNPDDYTDEDLFASGV